MFCALFLSAASALLGLAHEAPALAPSQPSVGISSAIPSGPPDGTLNPTAVPLQVRAEGAPAPFDDGRGTPYKVDKDDAICGLSEPRQLTNPAKVDYQALLDETAEIKELKRNKIDPASAKGIELTTKARTRVRDACETVRTDKGHCSVWKKITRRDRVAISDVTSSVKAELTGSGLFGL